MISYYDIRHAKTAMRSLQGKILRRRKLDIHYSIPKENPSEKDQNQGTLVVFNLDPSITKDELRDIFGVHGEIKEIRETPNKRHHKFIEFYDVRCAELAMKALNKTEIKSKRIKIEPSRPGGRKSSNGSRDDNSLQNSNDSNYYASEFANVSKSAPSPPNAFLSSSDSIGNNSSLQRRRTNLTSQTMNSSSSVSSNTQSNNSNHNDNSNSNNSNSISSQAPSTWSSNQHTNHRPLRSISLPPSGPIVNASNSNSSSSPSSNQERRSRPDDKRNFTLNIQAVQQGIDRRTTLMIKNIPNKYTQKMLLSTVDETHKGLYDFFYLPIDFKVN